MSGFITNRAIIHMQVLLIAYTNEVNVFPSGTLVLYWLFYVAVTLNTLENGH